MRHQSPIQRFCCQNQNLTSNQEHKKIIVHSPCQQYSVREQRAQSINQKLTQLRPQNTSSTTIKQIYRPMVETRTVHLCERKQHENLSHYESAHVNSELSDNLTLENQRLSKRIHEYQLEMESWRIRYQNVEQELYQRSADYDGLKQRYESEITFFKKEHEHYKSLYERVDRQHSDELGSLSNQNEDYQNRLALLSTEVERLNGMLMQKNNTLDQYQLQIKELKAYEVQVRVRDEIIEERNGEIGKLRKQALVALDSQNHIILIRAEFDRLEMLLKEKCDEYANLEFKLHETDSRFNALNLDFNKQQSQLKARNEECTTLRQQLQQNDTLFRNQISMFECQIHENQITIEALHQETTNLNIRLQTMISQVEYFQNESVELSNLRIQLQDEINQKYAEIIRLQMQIQQLTTDRQQSQDQLDRQTTEFKNVKVRFEETINQLKEILQNQGDEFNKLRLSLEKELQSKTQDFLLAQQTNFDLQNTIQEIQIKLTQYEEKISLLSAEIQRIVYTLNQKNTMIQEQATVLDEYANKINRLENEAQSHESANRELVSQCQEWETKLGYAQKSLEDYSQHLNSLETELFKEMKIRSELQNQLGAAELKYNALEQEFNEAVSKLRYAQQELNNEHNKRTDSEQQLLQLESSYGSLVNQFNSLKEQFNALQSQYQSVNSLLNSKTQENTQLQISNNTLTNEVTLKQQVIDSLKQSFSKQSEESQQMTIQLLEAAANLKNKERELEDLYNQIQQFENIQVEYTETQEHVAYLTKEIDSWKEKFVRLNRDYHKTQEDLMMLQAEFDAFKQRKNSVVIRESTSNFEVRKSTLIMEKENSLNSASKSKLPLSSNSIIY